MHRLYPLGKFHHVSFVDQFAESSDVPIVPDVIGHIGQRVIAGGTEQRSRTGTASQCLIDHGGCRRHAGFILKQQYTDL